MSSEASVEHILALWFLVQNQFALYIELSKIRINFCHISFIHIWSWMKQVILSSLCVWESEDSHLLKNNGYFYMNCHHSWVFKILRSCCKAYTSSKRGSYRYRGWFALGFIAEQFNFFRLLLSNVSYNTERASILMLQFNS